MPSLAPACGSVLWQRRLLRLTAIFQFIALPGFILPHIAAEKLSWLMGQVQPVLTPLLVYLAGGCAFVCFVLGILLWMFSNDVVRYRPLIIVSSWICLLGAPAFLWIDTQSHLPAWWVAMDSVSCLLFGVALLWACHAGRPSA